MTTPASLTQLSKSLRIYAQAIAENSGDWGKFEVESHAILTRLFDLARAHGHNEMLAEVMKLEPRVGVSPIVAK